MKVGHARPNVVLCRSGPDGSDWLAEALATHPDVTILPAGAEAGSAPLPGHFPEASPFATASRDGRAGDVFDALATSVPSPTRATVWMAAHAILQPQLPFVIHESLPDARLIFCVRDPAELVFELWRTAPPEAGLPADFAQAVARCHRAMLDTGRFDRRSAWTQHFRDLPLRETLLEHGMYGPVLERFERIVGRERMLVLPSERLRRDSAAAFDDVLRFLGLPESWHGQSPLPAFTPDTLGRPSRSQRDLLRPWFHASNERLRSLVGWSPEATQ